MFLLTKLLIRMFVKDSENVKNPEVRTAYGNMSGITGIVLNLILFLAKLLAGIFSSSVSIIADAFNNLSDAGSSVVTFLGFKLASRPADDEHPYGHGRYEYVAGMAISVVIFLVGFELFKSSVQKIFQPEAQTSLSAISVGILIASVVIKLWMFFFNRNLAKKISSNTLKATSMDSLTDSIATSLVLIGLLISKFTNVNIDGYLGCAVSVFIFLAGISTFKESLSPLLGNPPEQELVDEIRDTVLENEMVVGIHDLLVHDYGPGRCIISLHAEVPQDEDILKAHDAIDLIEKQLQCKFNCEATIHMDPIAVFDDYTVELRETIEKIILKINSSLSIHDFRIVKGNTHTNVIFDLVIPHKFCYSDKEILTLLREKVREFDDKLMLVVHIDKIYISSSGSVKC